MATKPSTTPRFAETAGGAPATNIATPSSGQQDTGWTVGQAPPSSYFNWWMRLVYDWILYLKDAVFTATPSSGLAGVSGTGDGAAAGVSGTGGSTSGTGGAFTGGATNGRGVTGQGTGSGDGAAFTGGATGNGVTGSGGATSGYGGQFTGNSAGVSATGQGTAPGVVGSGSTTGAGGAFTGGGGLTGGPGVSAAAGAGTLSGGRGAIHLVASTGAAAGVGYGCQPGDITWNGTNFLVCKTAGTWTVLI
jgi:hypothetical protein